MSTPSPIHVVGGGLAGSEAAWQIASAGVPVVLHEMRPVRGTGWQESQPEDRRVRQELRLVLRDSGLPPQGEIFDRAYAYIRENY